MMTSVSDSRERRWVMELLTPWHLALILLGFLLLFGYKRLPDASRSVGRSLRIFKAEMRELSDIPGLR